MGVFKKFLLLAACSGLWLVSPIHAQWTPVFTFPGQEPISAVYFLDAQGVPGTGFVGSGPIIYRTTNAGTTWNAVQQGLSGWPTSFEFQNSRIGWCSVGGQPSGTAIYKTIDGGATWAPLPVTSYGTDVSYNHANGLLFLALRAATSSGTSLVSSDGGATWAAMNSQFDENGFVFCDPSHGVLTAHTSPFYRTNDGGVTWYDLGYTLHTWAAAALPSTSTFVAAEDMTSNIHTSTDAGVTWMQTSMVTGTLTGCVQTGPCNVYVQSNEGIFNSSDLLTWIPMGGPGNMYDTRFYVGPTTMYAGDVVGNLFSLSSRGGGWPTLDIEPPVIHVATAEGCPIEPVTATFQNVCCLPLTIVSASIADSSNWSLSPNQPLPLTLLPEDSTQFTITATGGSSGSFHDRLQLVVKTPSGLTDTVVLLDLDAATIIPPTLKAPKVTLPDRCTSIDTAFYIRNNHCDTIQITSLSMLDTSLFDLSLIALPIVLAPDSGCAIPLAARPKTIGNFSDTVAIALSYHGSLFDTLLALKGSVQVGAITAALSSNAIAFDTISQCDNAFDTIYLSNSSCDSVELTQAYFGGSSFIIRDSILERWIAPGDSLAIVIELSGSQPQGNYSDDLALELRNGGVAGQPFSLTVNGSVRTPPATLDLNPAAIRTDSISQCLTYDTVMFLTIQSGCDSLSIASASFVGTANVNVTASPALPRVLHAGDTVLLFISYRSPTGAAVDGSITVQGPIVDTSIPLHLSFRADTQPLRITISQTSFAAYPCAEVDSGTVTISNPGCEAIVLDSLDVFPAGPFQLGPIMLPRSIPADSTITGSIYFLGSNGAAATILGSLHSNDETGHAQSISLTGTMLPLDTARVGLALAPGSTLQPLTGGTTSPLVYFTDSVALGSNLQSMHCTLTFNGNVLTETGAPTGLNGWNVQEQTPSLGRIDLDFTRAGSAPIAPGQPVASLLLQAFLSDSLETPVTLSNVTFMPNDPTYEQCTLASAIAVPSIAVQLGTQCGDSVIWKSLRMEPFLSSVTATAEGDNVLISFQSGEECTVTLAMSDVLGRVRSEINYQAIPGANAVTIPTSSLAGGMYFVAISSFGLRITKQIAVLR